jgi:hypothetical protein
MRVYHAAARAATRWIACAWLCAMLLPAGVRAAMLAPVPATPAARLEAAVRAAFAQPEKLYKVIPLTMPPDEEAKTLRALRFLFRNARVDEVITRDVTDAGRVGFLKVRVRDVDVFGLRVDEMCVEAEDFPVDVKALEAGDLRVIGDARSRMSARVLEEDVNRVSPAYRIELADGDFAVSGRAGVLFIRAGYRLHGTLVATPENTLVFRPKSLSYGILPVPRAFYMSAVRRLNPVFDMARFLGSARSGFDLKFERVDLEKGRAGVALSGTIRARPTPLELLPPLPPVPPRKD